MNQIEEKLLTSIQESITHRLQEGSMKMGDIVPLAHYVGTLDVDEPMAPTYDQLIITPNYMEDLRKYYEMTTKA